MLLCWLISEFLIYSSDEDEDEDVDGEEDEDEEDEDEEEDEEDSMDEDEDDECEDFGMGMKEEVTCFHTFSLLFCIFIIDFELTIDLCCSLVQTVVAQQLWHFWRAETCMLQMLVILGVLSVAMGQPLRWVLTINLRILLNGSAF